MIQSRRRQGTIEMLRRMGTREVALLVRRRTWSSKIALGLRADATAFTCFASSSGTSPAERRSS
jgi:hypothetical protein